MIAGALNFTLGLQANQFLNNLGIASGKLVGFLGVANAVQMAFNRMWAAVQQGGKLTDLAAAANVTVKDLYQLRFAFEQVGGSADAVGSVLQRLRSNLAGGQQDSLLASLGLDATSLRQANAAEQFTRIAAALARVDVTTRAGAAQKLFGREGAQVIQQIANSGDDFARAMSSAAADATVWDRVSATFDRIADQVTAIQRKMETMWALLAGSLVAAFQEGRLLEVLFDIFSSVFQSLGQALPGLLAGGLVKLGELLLRVFQLPLTFLQTAFDVFIQEKFAQIAQIPGLRDLLGVPANFKPQGFREAFQANQENGLSFFGATLGDMSDFAARAIADALRNGKEPIAALGERLNALLGTLPQNTLAAAVIGGGTLGGKTSKPNVTDLERMGFVFNRGGLGGTDYTRDTANNTRRANEILGRIENKIVPGNSASFANQ